MEELVIRSESQAFEVLEKALANELSDVPFSLKFERWPVLKIKLEGPGFESTINTDIAQALIDIQASVNRAYARAVHNLPDSRGLTAEERKQLQFQAKVKQGSSIIEVNLGEFAEKLATGIASKMTPEMFAITVIGVALTGAGFLAYKQFLKHKSSDKQIEQEVRSRMIMTQEETRRLEVFADAMVRSATVRHASEDFDAARNEIVRAGRNADSLTVNSISIDSATARTIGTAHRSESIEVQLNGNYTILSVDVSRPDEIKLRVQNRNDGRDFSASFQDQSLDQSQITLLQAAEWSRNPVYLSINARILRGEITVATVVAVTQQPLA